MKKPYILSIDDDPQVLSAVERDLHSYYAKDYRVVSLNLGRIALDFLRKIQAEQGTVALFLVDQRMPQMTGVEFLKEARLLFPAAMRVLLTAYADTEAAVEAINDVRLHYYMLKPWDPPEEKLFPVLNDLLAEWSAKMYPPGKRG